MTGWAECPPGRAGVAAAGLDRALDLVRARGAAAQLCVVRDGQVVLDHAVGCRPDSLFWTFSASKPFVALLVHLLAQRGELDGVRILEAATIGQARQPSSHGEQDRFLRLPMWWSHGFQLGGGPGPAAARPMGQLAGPRTFGHNGSNCCLAWADPARRLVFAYLTDLLTAGSGGARHQGQVSDAVIAACS